MTDDKDAVPRGDDDMDFDDRLWLVEERLRYKKMGMSGASLPRYDFDEYVLDDVQWLLDTINDRESEAESRAQAAREEFDGIRDQILTLPGDIERAETKIIDAGDAIQKVNQQVHKFRKAIGKLRDELGLFDENSDMQLYAARKALDDERTDRARDAEEFRHGKIVLEAQIQRLDTEVAKLKSQGEKLRLDARDREAELGGRIRALQERLDGLPPTWQERILVGSGILPKWAVIGAAVVSKTGSVTGKIKGFSLDQVQIDTDIGELTCSLDLFQSEWRGR